jgi:hypothetical protein
MIGFKRFYLYLFSKVPMAEDLEAMLSQMSDKFDESFAD